MLKFEVESKTRKTRKRFKSSAVIKKKNSVGEERVGESVGELENAIS